MTVVAPGLFHMSFHLVPRLKQCPLFGPCWPQDGKQEYRSILKPLLKLAHSHFRHIPRTKVKYMAKSNISSMEKICFPREREGGSEYLLNKNIIYHELLPELFSTLL